MRLPGIGSHESARSLTDEWLTPPAILRALGEFDLDPCSPMSRPWPTALRHLTLADDGLDRPWQGRVWLNPPYSEVGPWVARMARHGRGTALVFARTETDWWQRFVWSSASCVLFLSGRVSFYRADGTPAGSPGAPSALAAYGRDDAVLLRRSRLPGAYAGPAEVVPGRLAGR